MHCHLDLYPDPKAALEAIKRNGAYVLSVTTTPSAWVGTAQLARSNSRVRTAIGLHPQLARERKSELSLFDRLLSETRYVGEVGLDGGPECAPFWNDQVEVFDHVLSSCSKAGGRILTIHSRRAANDVLDALERHAGFGVAVLHWFSGSFSELDRAIKFGCWFSVGSAMLRGKKGRELLSRMPANRVLTETDGPFATLNGRALKPADCDIAINVMSDLWGMDKHHAKETVLASFRELVSSLERLHNLHR